MFDGVKIFNQHCIVTAAYASHSVNHFGGLLHVMQSEATHYNIEFAFV
jgi:hypothetical protein